MDYRVIGYETLELEFGNQKVPGFLQKNGFWCKNGTTFRKISHFISSKITFPIKIPFLNSDFSVLTAMYKIFRIKIGHFQGTYSGTVRTEWVLTVYCQNDIFVLYNLCFE